MPPNTSSPKNSLAIPLAILIAGVMVSGAIYFGGAREETIAGNREIKVGDVKEVTSSDYIFGSPNAEVKIIEYSDLECPFCKVFHSTLRSIVEEYGGRVAWIYRHYPIVELHPAAFKEAEAAECAAEQGGNVTFWRYIDRVFDITNSNNSLPPAELPRIATALGLNVEQFNQCLSSGKYTEKINQAVKDALSAGARGTPYSVVVKGKEMIPIVGAESIEFVRSVINDILD